MKTLLVFVALGSVIAAPAFAQAPYHLPTSLHGWASRVHVYAPNHYARHEVQNNNTNPDFQLGGADR
jgi:hypothetical protein